MPVPNVIRIRTMQKLSFASGTLQIKEIKPIEREINQANAIFVREFEKLIFMQQIIYFLYLALRYNNPWAIREMLTIIIFKSNSVAILETDILVIEKLTVFKTRVYVKWKC